MDPVTKKDDQQELPDAAPATENQTEPDGWEKRFSSRYPDVDMSTREGRHAGYSAMMDGYEGLENSVRAMQQTIKDEPMVAEMIEAMRKAGPGKFNLLSWADSEGIIDVEDYISSSDKDASLEKSSAAWKERQNQAEEIRKAREKNKPVSAQAIAQVNSELGISDEQSDEAISKMYQIMDDLVVHKVDPDIYRMIVKGMNYDQATSDARQEGELKGMNKRVIDKLRKMPASPERISGSQAPVGEPASERGGVFDF